MSLLLWVPEARYVRVFAFAALLLIAASAHAQTVTWTGAAGTSNWHTADNWSPSAIPASSSDVVIPAGAGTVTISSASVTVQSLTLFRPLTVSSSRTLSAASIDLRSLLTVSGATLADAACTIGAGGELAFNTSCANRLSSVTINGDLPNFAGRVRWSGTVLNGTLTMLPGSRLYFEGDQTLTGTIVGNIADGQTYASLTPYASGTLTIAPTATIRGTGIQIVNATSSGNCVASSLSMRLANQGTIESGGIARPFIIGVPISNSTGTFGGLIDVSTLEDSTVTLSPGAELRFSASCANRLSNVTINGDLPNFRGYLRWNNVTLNGTLTMKPASRIFFERNQTITGTIVGDVADGQSYANLSPYDSGTLTIAPTATVRGSGIEFINSTGTCSLGENMQLANNGMIESIGSDRPISIDIPILNSTGTFSGLFDLSTLKDSTVTLTPGTEFRFSTSCNNSLNNVTINGDLPNFTGYLQWRNVTLNGTLTMQPASKIFFEGDQTLTGTIVGNVADGQAYASLTPRTSGTLTIAPTAVVRGSGIEFVRYTGSCVSAGLNMALANNGTIQSTSTTRPFNIDVPIINSNGVFSGLIDVKTIENSTVTLAPGTELRFSTSCGNRLTNVTINGDLPNFTGYLQWSNVTLNGTLTMKPASKIFFGGNQTLTGTIIGDVADGQSYASLTPYATGTLTIAPTAVIRGSGIQFVSYTGSCVAAGLSMFLTNNGTIESVGTARPFSIDVSILNSTGTFSGLFTDINILQNNTITLTPGTEFRFDTSCTNRLSNTTVNGDLPNFAGYLRWNNVTLNGTLTMKPASKIFFEGNQTLTGTFVGDVADGQSYASFAPRTSGTLTIAPTTVISGSGIEFVSYTGSCVAAGLSMPTVNFGLLNGTNPVRPIISSVPFLNLGTITGSVNTPGGSFGTPYTSAGPTNDAVADSPRPDPGAGSTQTLEYKNLYITPGTPFHLGSGETLNLDNGNGTLYIGPGATFWGNGTINGHVVNQGLLIIPITQAGLIFNVTGTGTVIIGGGGSGGGGGGGGGSGGGYCWRCACCSNCCNSGGGSSPSYSFPGRPGLTVFAGGQTQTITSSPISPGGIVWDGRLDVTGSFTQTETGVLRFFIAGATQGETYSMLNVLQSVTLDGELQIVLDPELLNFLPRQGDTFDIIVGAQGITLPPDGLTVRSLITGSGAALLGLNLAAFNSSFIDDPDRLAEFPTNIFSYQLINGGTTLRITMTQSLCFATATPAEQSRCSGSTFAATAQPLGAFGPFAYQWQVADGAAVGGWRTIADGAMLIDGAEWGTVSGTDTQTCTLNHSAGYIASTISIRALVTSDCASVPSNPVAVTVCAADFNCSGAVTADDIFTFLDAWFIQNGQSGPSLSADFNNSLDVTADDIFAFLDAWFAQNGSCN